MSSSRPESRITDQRLAFSYQNPAIEPLYKIARKQLKVSIAQFPQGFLKTFRLQHKALTLWRRKHPVWLCCTGVPYSFMEKYFQDWSPEILIEDTIVFEQRSKLTLVFHLEVKPWVETGVEDVYKI